MRSGGMRRGGCVSVGMKEQGARCTPPVGHKVGPGGSGGSERP